MAYAPNAIRSAATTITGGIGGAVFSGVVGDSLHSFGYHLARNQLPASDYSVQLAADRDGNGDAASALDISLPPAQMIAVTTRLRAAARAGDPRLFALREFAGTLDGRTTFNRDLSNGGEGFGNWDDSHLWHIHLSGYRRYADDPNAWRAIADVFTDSASVGGALSEEDDFMSELSAEEQRNVYNWLEAIVKADSNVPAGLALNSIMDRTGKIQAILDLNPDTAIGLAMNMLLGRTGSIADGGTAADPEKVAAAVVKLLGTDLAGKVAPLLTVTVKAS